MTMYLSWIFLVACTIWVCLLAFVWALQDGQFSDQNRARYLPLAEDFRKAAAENLPWKGLEGYYYGFMAAVMLFFFGTAVYLGLTAGL
jgi:cbb3-type cytochrome oxidase maturation protein